MSIIKNKISTIFFCYKDLNEKSYAKDLDENSHEKRIENIEKGKSYLKSNRLF